MRLVCSTYAKLTTATLLAAFVAISCGKEKAQEEAAPPAPPAKLSFATDIAPIIEAKCAPCHASGSKLPNYVGNEAMMVEHKGEILNRIGRGTDEKGVMPTKKSGKVLSDDEKNKIRRFLAG